MGLKNLSPEDYAIAIGLAQEQGIKFPVKSEKWHATYYGENAKYIKNATTGNSRKDPQFENDFERQKFNTEEDILRLNEQYDVLKSLNPLVDDYGYNLAFVEAKRKLLSDAEKEGLSLTPEQLQAVDELAKKYAEASAKVNKFTQDQQLANQRVEDLRSSTKDVFGGMIKDMKSGTSAAEALANALDKIADKLMDMTLNFLFDTKSSGGSGIFDSFFQSGGDAIGKFFGSLLVSEIAKIQKEGALAESATDINYHTARKIEKEVENFYYEMITRRMSANLQGQKREQLSKAQER